MPPELGIDHFAAFPLEFPRRIIKGWSPSGICVECGEGRRPVSEATGRKVASSVDPARSALLGGDGNKYDGRDFGGTYARAAGGPQLLKNERVITGEACACPTPDAPTRPAVVLDPFGGTGTTSLVASALGRTGISVDLSHDYSRLARWRTNDPGQRASAMQVEKPPVELAGQADLFGDVA